MKRIALFVCLLALASGSISPALAIVDMGDPSVTRLWVPTENGDRFACSATWIRPARSGVSWLITAGHCAMAPYVKRDVNQTVVAHVDWRVVIQSHRYAGRLLDIAIGTAPDTREVQKFQSFIASEFPKEGQVYIHGFPAGVESVVAARVIGPSKAPNLLGTMEVKVPAGSILPGSSGSAVINADGYLVGIVWGIHLDHDPETGAVLPGDVAYVTPIEAFHEIVKMIDAKVQGDGE